MFIKLTFAKLVLVFFIYCFRISGEFNTGNIQSSVNYYMHLLFVKQKVFISSLFIVMHRYKYL